MEGRDEYFFSKWVLDESDQERAGYLRPTDVPFPADNLANRVPYMDGARPKGVYFPGRVFEASIEGIGGHPVVNDWVKPDVMFCHISGRNAKMNTYDATYVKLREVAKSFCGKLLSRVCVCRLLDVTWLFCSRILHKESILKRLLRLGTVKVLSKVIRCLPQLMVLT